MITSSDFFAAATEALGMTILHSLWQGFLLMLALGLFLRFGKSLTPATRFSVAFITLLLLLTAFVGTFYQQWSLVAPVTISPSLTETLPAEITKTAPVVLNPTVEQLTVTEPDRWEALFSHLTIMAPWLAWVWLVGSLIFIIRLANGLVQNRQLQSDTISLPADWPQRFGKLMARLQIRQSVRVESTERTKVPLTIGWIKPVILIPVSLLTSLPTDQVEAIMVHELAHIKRQDYLWNLIQSAAEVVLFYHPVYWYISSVLERERELACDALTVATTRQPRTYAQALLEIAARASAPIPTQSLAASGKRGLLSRIQQIMNPDAPRKNISVLPFLLLLSMLSLSLVAFAWHQPDLNLSSDQETADSLHQPVYSDQGGYGTMKPEFLQPLEQPGTTPIDYGPSFQEVMARLSDEFLDTTSLTMDEMYGQSITIDQYLNQFSRSAAQKSSSALDSTMNTPVNYSSPLIVYLVDGEVINPKQVKRYSVQHFEVFRAPFSADLQNLVNREYSVVVRAISKESASRKTQGQLRQPDYVGYGHFAYQTMPLSWHLSFISQDGYLVGQNDFSQPDINPRTFFQKSTLYMLDNQVVDNADNIRLNKVRRFEVYYNPLPQSLQGLSDGNYLAVVKAFSQEYEQPNSLPFVARGQVVTREETQYKPLPNIKVEVKESGRQTFTDAVGKFQLPADPQQTLIFYWPDEEPQEIGIDGREFTDITHYTGTLRLNKYRDNLQKRLYQRMDALALAKDREAIQKELKRLKQAKDSLQYDKRQGLNEKIIDGRVLDSFANKGIAGVLIKTLEGSEAVTDEKRYYEISLPATTQQTTFEFSHPDFPTRQVKVDATLQKQVVLGQDIIEEEQSVVHNIRLPADSIGPNSPEQNSDNTLYIIDGVIQPEGTNLSDIPSPEGQSTISVFFVGSFLSKKYEELPLEGKEYIVVITNQANKKDASDRTVRGRIIDEKTSEPLAGVEIVWENAPNDQVLTHTDISGEYQFTLPETATVISYSLPNYNDYIMTARDLLLIPSHFILALKPSSYAEFGSTETKERFGMKGVAPANSTKSDSINLSNFLPINSDNEMTPLLVLNGKAQTRANFLNSLEPETIKSIETLKSSEAQERYGERAAGGAVLIKTQEKSATEVIQGRVLSKETGLPLSGVQVSVDDRKIVVTDSDGNYKISVPEHPVYVTFSLNGYETSRGFTNGYPPFPLEVHLQKTPTEAEIASLYRKLVQRPTPRTLYLINNIVEANYNELPPLDLEDIQSIRLVNSNDASTFFRESTLKDSYDQAVFISLHESYQRKTEPFKTAMNSQTGEPISLDMAKLYIALQSDDEKQLLFIIDDIVQPERKNLSDIQPEDIASIEVVKVKGNRADQFEGLPIDGKDEVVFVTTSNSFRVIEGKVTDIETGQPVPGVNIEVKGTTIRTVTNEEGNYRATIPENSTQLEFTATNYDLVTAHISEKKVVNIQIGQRLEKSLENALFVVDGQIREDIREFDDLNLSKEDLKHIETFKENRWRTFPQEYQEKGYTKVAKIVTKDFQPQLAYRTVRGKLIDASNGDPLVGAEIRWVKQDKRTVLAHTDERGEYQVTLPKNAKMIEYFHPDYILRETTDRFVVELFPMSWTLTMRRKNITDKKLDFTRQLIISPNPGHDEIKVSFSLNEAASVEFELLDKAGNILHSVEYHYNEAGKKEETLSTSQFPADTYLLRAKLNGEYVTKRVILNN
uniref:Carboxypeptidase-like regulatory domain-containing protein n=1 Tax=Roseihalotalea indica TaxID=2867963 RepID=A0AA49GSJ4_9BACT|nr:carboxypeptidase-like regulatory domain-containing protein [Tunicatimonas sp. TK19036]